MDIPQNKYHVLSIPHIFLISVKVTTIRFGHEKHVDFFWPLTLYIQKYLQVLLVLHPDAFQIHPLYPIQSKPPAFLTVRAFYLVSVFPFLIFPPALDQFPTWKSF